MAGPVLRLDEVADVAEEAADRRAEAVDDAKARLASCRCQEPRDCVHRRSASSEEPLAHVDRVAGQDRIVEIELPVTSAPSMLRVTCTQWRLARGVKPPATAIADCTVSPAT